jgi:hydroxymethylpyrimidine/phosphomethylpyrimidine kinase
VGLIHRPVALTVAGSDSSGGAGIVADVKTFDAFGVWATVALTAVTAQNASGVSSVSLVPVDVLVAQMRAVAADPGIAATKTGMLGSPEAVEAVADALVELEVGAVVVDPVLRASADGYALQADDTLDCIREHLLPVAGVLTPNLDEAEALTGRSVTDRGDMEVVARQLAGMGARAVLLKGGHLGDGDASPDLLWSDGCARWLEGPRLPGRPVHGTGCALSAAIAAGMALGRSVEEACTEAKIFVAACIARSAIPGDAGGRAEPGKLESPTAPGDRPRPHPRTRFRRR